MRKLEKKITIIPATKKLTGDSVDNDRILRVAAYARVSTDKDDQVNSLETQVEYFNDYIRRNPKWELVEVYADEGLSGLSTKKRVNFNRMIDDARHGKIDMILSKSISRFARNVLDTIGLTRELKILGIPIYFGKENINTFDPNGEFLLNFMASFAEEKSKSISKNVRWSLKCKNKKGHVTLAYKYFLGYRRGIEKYQMEIIPKEVKIVRLIYKLYLNGLTISSVAKYLNNQNIPSSMNKTWRKNAVHSILSNEKYIGDALLQKSYTVDIYSKKHKKNDGVQEREYIENDQPAIIERDTFKEVQEQMLKRKQESSTNFFYSKKLHCVQCGATYQRNFYYHEYYSEAIIRWICTNKHKEVWCDNIVLYEDELNYAFQKS